MNNREHILSFKCVLSSLYLCIVYSNLSFIINLGNSKVKKEKTQLVPFLLSEKKISGENEFFYHSLFLHTNDEFWIMENSSIGLGLGLFVPWQSL